MGSSFASTSAPATTPADASTQPLVHLPQLSDVARELILNSDVIDLHVESYSFYRSFGYHPRKRHGAGLHRALLVGQADLPRLDAAGFSGATWVISANPLRPSSDRGDAFLRMLRELTSLLEAPPERARIVRSGGEYRRAVEAGLHAAFVGIQGANALPESPEFLERIAADVTRITLLHLTDSAWGASSTPLPRLGQPRLGSTGHAYIEAMNRYGILVDLAHMHEKAFAEATRAQAPGVPIVVTHTGVRAIHNHWRNLSDEQLRAIADTGGVVGIMYHSQYLGDGLFSGKMSQIVAHIRHTLDVIGEDHVALGSDWDGAICTPRDMPTCLEWPLLVDALLQSGVPDLAVQKILGQNFLRVVNQVRDPLYYRPL